MEKDYTSLVDRIDSLEKKLEKGVVMAAPGSARQGVGGSAQGAQGGSLPKAELPKACLLYTSPRGLICMFL